MNEVKQWIQLDPLDTLFFKGSEPMIAGESHEVNSVFPPMPSTLLGALCTAILQQRGLKPEDFTRQEGPDPKITEKFPFLGRPGDEEYEPDYQITGPIFLLNPGQAKQTWVLPVPAHCFAKVPDYPEDGEKLQVVQASLFPDIAQPLGLSGTVADPLWIIDPPERDMESLSGYWINQAGLKDMSARSDQFAVQIRTSVESVKPDEPAIMRLTTLFGNEARVGIALEDGIRRARKGYLYTTTQVRLKAGVNMAIGLSEELIPAYLDKQGILQLGGEQRMVHYLQLSDGPDLSESKSPWMMALSPFPYKELEIKGWKNCPWASGRLIRMGGWDMKKGFPKCMKAYLPAGTVVLVGEDAAVPYGFIRL